MTTKFSPEAVQKIARLSSLELTEKETEVSKTASVTERAEMKEIEQDFPERGKLRCDVSSP